MFVIVRSLTRYADRLIRDALVEKIWEGTVTVLSLDVVRAASKPAVLDAFLTVSYPLSDAPPQILIEFTVGKLGVAHVHA